MSTQRGGSNVGRGPQCPACGNDLRYVGDRQLPEHNMHHERRWVCANPHCARDQEVVIR